MAVSTLAVCALLTLAACSKKENTEQSNNAPTESAAPAATPIDPATVATIKGTVKFDGTAPKPSKIDMSQDPGCKGTNEAENIVVSGGDLANVFVYVKDGLGNRTFDVPQTPVVLEQKGCRYHPHVLGVMAGQTVDIKNADPTTHNIHPTPKDNREWNESQPPVFRRHPEEFRARRNHAAREVQPASLDEDVHQRGQEPVLRRHRQRWKV